MGGNFPGGNFPVGNFPRTNKNSDNEKLLGVTVDSNLNFNCHLEKILKKAT